jgi:murein DD-endopeptidase MepM/ murein hydrolase activator NlpD
MLRRKKDTKLRAIFKCSALAVVCGASLASPWHESVALPTTNNAAALTLMQSFVYPVMGPRESSPFGVRKHPVRGGHRHHSGIDLAAPRGATIRAIAPGRVMYADPLGAYGKLVVIEHQNGLTSHYGHCEALKVNIGQVVQAGDIIATVGSSGVSTGPHLHFEIRRNGKPEHPERYLPGLDNPTEG